MKIQEQIKRDEQIADNTGEYRVITTDELIERLKNETPPVVTHLPIPMLDRLMNGVEVGEITLIGGWPGNGKTQLCTFITKKLDKATVMWFSYEVTARGLMARYNYEPPLFYIPNKIKGHDIIWMLEMIERAKANFPSIRHIFIDCVQSLYEASRWKNATMEISGIMAKIKETAINHELNVWMPSRLNKPSRDTLRSEHQMGDVPDAAALEHEVDFSIYIQRVPNVYDVNKKGRQEMEWSDDAGDNRALIKIVKARRENAKTGKILVELLGGEYREITNAFSEPLVEPEKESFKSLWR